MLDPKDIIRFNEKKRLPDNNGCALWKDKPDKKGYGRFYLKGKNLLAHHVAFMIYYNREPAGYIKHTCNNPLCMNGGHLIEKGAETPHYKENESASF